MVIDFPSVKYSSMTTEMCLYFLVVMLDILINQVHAGFLEQVWQLLFSSEPLGETSLGPT